MPLRFSVPGSALVRTAAVYIPPDWYDYVPIPLVLVLHGGGMSATSMANSHPFHLVVALPVATYPPVPTPLAADFARCITVFFEGLAPDMAALDGKGNFDIGHPRSLITQPWRYGDDVAAIEHLVATLGEHLDRTLVGPLGRAGPAIGAVHAYGYSNGGMLAYRLAGHEDLSFDLRSIFVASGSIGAHPDSLDPRRLPDSQFPTAGVPPRSILHLHGDDDTEVNPDGDPVVFSVKERGILRDQGSDPNDLALRYRDTPLEIAAQRWREHNDPTAPVFAGAANRALFELPTATPSELMTHRAGDHVVATARYPGIGHIWDPGPNDLVGLTMCRMARLFFYDPTNFGP